ncbi:hypothetical protein EDD15DRAFT_2507260 [Pisolithus albus]|nr:hypothetical protein EDD15DRAFT_2507260 [Pisolithus albus]
MNTAKERVNAGSNDDEPTVPRVPKDLLLVQGTDSTFGSFPSRLEHILTETMDKVTVECTVFPAYELPTGGGAGAAKIVLCGHSMGGLLAADTLRAFIRSRPDEGAPLWPRVIGCIAFDTPYLGLHPFVFKNSATRVAEAADTARTIVSDCALFHGERSGYIAPAKDSESTSKDTGWARWAPAAYTVGGAIAAGAAAGAAYWRREDITSGYKWAFDHMKYVGNLWDKEAMGKRLDDLVLVEQRGITFKMFYVLLPPSLPAFPSLRTFVVLPPRSSPAFASYIISRNSIASDEVQAHMGMFEPTQNDGYYELGLETARIIREASARSGQMHSTAPT